MIVMDFQNFEFHDGLNITVRKGKKWNRFPMPVNGYVKLAGSEETIENMMHVAFIGSIYLQFKDIPEELLEFEHDPSCHNITNLLLEMQSIYPEFNS